MVSVSAADVRHFRLRAQQMHRGSGALDDTAVLEIGVQDTGADGGMWALTNRGVAVADLPAEALVTAWTIRGAPHLYRRNDLPQVARAVEPFSDEDAARRIFDAAKPLKAAGITALGALDAVATAMRSVVKEPMVKGEVSSRVTALMGPPYRRFCRPCQAIHLYEMPFRLAALRAGLELVAGTSPPVLRPVPGFSPADQIDDRFDVVRSYLRLLGPATPAHVAGYLDSPVEEVKARWPKDAVKVSVDAQSRWALAADEDRLAGEPVDIARLLGPFDLFLQARDRPLLVGDSSRIKALWPVLGRPGGVVVDGEILGLWRPRKSGRKLDVRMELWAEPTPSVRSALQEQAERLALSRQARLSTVDILIG